eukprot:9354239-Alexandrium_andersonii.AAC.1
MPRHAGRRVRFVSPPTFQGVPRRGRNYAGWEYPEEPEGPWGRVAGPMPPTHVFGVGSEAMLCRPC